MISAVQNQEEYIIRFQYDPKVVELVKNVPGRRYNPEHKYWTIPLARLGFLVNQLKGTPYESQLEVYSAEHIDENDTLDPTQLSAIPDIDISNLPLYVQDGCSLFSHQTDFMKYAIGRQRMGLRGGFILGDEPGCIDGRAKIRIRDEGKNWTRETTLSNAYKLYKAGNRFQIKTMCDGRFVYLPIKRVLDKGIRPTLELVLEGYSIVCTPDHEIYTTQGWKRADSITMDDMVFTNGSTPKCIICGNSTDVITYPYAKFKGYCRTCMYASRDCTKYKGDIVHKVVDADGYVRLRGLSTRSWPLYSRFKEYGILEHHQVWYEHTGHIVDPKVESIHHINHDKTDNRIENLQLLSNSEHSKVHADTATDRLPQNQDVEYIYCHGVKTWVVPHPVKVLQIKEVGDNHVYDIMIDHPTVHNFIANGVVVHNCGKTLQVMNLALYNRKFNKHKHCLIIACVNSAKYNWVYDIEKHTNGAETPYILGSRKRRNGTIKYDGSSEAKLKDLSCGHMYGDKKAPKLPYFLVMNIEALRMKSNRHFVIREKLVELINKGYIGMIAVDEIHTNCLHYDTLINTDMGLIPIGEVVARRLNVNVQSYNENSGELQWKPIVNWFTNSNSGSLLELNFDTENGTRTVRCTPNHKFYTHNRGWVCAKDLNEDDDIACTCE